MHSSGSRVNQRQPRWLSCRGAPLPSLLPHVTAQPQGRVGLGTSDGAGLGWKWCHEVNSGLCPTAPSPGEAWRPAGCDTGERQ